MLLYTITLSKRGLEKNQSLPFLIQEILLYS